MTVTPTPGSVECACDDAVVCGWIANDPRYSNIVYIVDGTSSIVDDIRSGLLVHDELPDLLDELSSQERITGAVLRCLKAGRLRAHRECDPDGSLHIVVITTALRVVP